jgi:hypothetical protein
MGTASLVAVFHLVAAAVKRTLERGGKTRKTSRKKTKRRGRARTQASYYEVGGQSGKKSATHSRTQGNSENLRKIRTQGKFGQREYLGPEPSR